jgi:hypothetical protein
MQNPFKEATRSAYEAKGELSLEQIVPMVEYKAAYQDRLRAIESRRAAKRAERGKPDFYLNARANHRADARRAAKERKRGQRAFDRMTAARAQNEITAGNMARALAGEFDHISPHIRTNVKVVADREAAKAAKAND